MRLYQGWQSSASWRVRWALALKKVPYDGVFVDVQTGEHHAVLAPINPMHQVPTLELGDGRVLTESVAIIEWLEETIPEPRLLPADPFERAHARELVQLINSGVHPLQNTITRLAVSSDRDEQNRWASRWIERGLAAYEAHLAQRSGRFSLGDEVTMPDLFLVPQVGNAQRHRADISGLPRVQAVCAACLETPEARDTQPRRA